MNEINWLPAMNTEGAQTLLRQIFNIYVQPEVDRRRTKGDQVDAEIWAAQVAFDPENNEPQVRLNREVQLMALPIGSNQAADYVELRDKGYRDFTSLHLPQK